ncbi:MATE family efflux transporter [Sphingorhabdus arenilitoris]|uniref:Multidrug-efflux transporter n=1 Tax=Sphingorhabdus arenilitoris TaxID=1490041 RepID=A0ABV8RGS8_9SPHN
MQPPALPYHPRQAWSHELAATIRLAWPLVCTNVTMALIGATDVLMIGWLGPTQLASASLGFNLAMLLSIFSMGLITAASPMMASEIGRKPNSVRDVRRTFRQSLWTALIICIPIWAILWNSGDLLLLLGQKPQLAALAQDYVRAYMWSILPFLWTLAARNFLSALEKPIWSLIIGIAGVIANAIFNYALIFGEFGAPALGVVGAGIGSILANSFMFLCMILVISRHKDFRRYRLFGRWWRSDWPRFREMWRLGLPIGISFGLEGGVFSVAVMLMGLISVEAVAAHAIALQIASLSFMVPMGLGQAATVRVGIGYGRKDAAMIRRAGWTSFVLGTGFMTVMAALLWIFPQQLISIFLQDAAANPNVAMLAVQFLAVAALFQIVDGAQVVGQGMLRGLHDTRMPMVIAGFGYWVVGIGVGAWLAFSAGWQGVGIWTGLATGLGIVAVLILIRWTMRARLGLLPA